MPPNEHAIVGVVVVLVGMGVLVLRRCVLLRLRMIRAVLRESEASPQQCAARLSQNTAENGDIRVISGR